MAVSHFNINDKVFCVHGPGIYKAKIVDAVPEGKSYKYLVHYDGWNSKWDEYVPEARVLEINDANTKKFIEQEESPGAKKKRRSGVMRDKEGPGTSSRPSTPSVDGGKQKSSRASTGSDSNVEPRRKRARLDPYVESEAQYLSRAEVKVKMPDDLKPLLVDDWDYVTRQFKLVNVPVQPQHSVRQILEDYIAARSSAKGMTPQKLSQIQEAANGIKEYFETMLGTQLLYKFERVQYSEIVHKRPERKMCDIYGFIHLLRLFVRFGNMLAYTSLSEKNIAMILSHINDFLKYLQKNQATLFNLDDYSIASPEYQRRALS